MLGEKFFLWNSIPNLVLITALIYYLVLRRSVGAVFAVIFTYLSLHGGYAIFAALTGDGINTMNSLHYESSDPGAKMVGATFLLGCSVLLVLRINQPLAELRRITTHFRLLLGITFIYLVLMVYGALALPNMPRGTLLTILKEVAFGSAMWVGAVMFSFLIRQSVPYFIERRDEWGVALGSVLLIMMGCGFIEIGTGIVWAGTYYATGFSYRASGALFNPNVLGFWSAMLVILISLGFHLRCLSRQVAFWGMALVVLGLILSSSRSGFVLSLISLATLSLFLFWGAGFVTQSRLDRVWPLVSYGLVFAMWTVLIKLASHFNYQTVTTLQANLLRFWHLPGDLFWIFMVKIFLPMTSNIEKFLGGPLMSAVKNWNAAAGGPFSESELESSRLFQPGWREGILETMNAATSTNATGKMMESINGRTLLEYVSDNSFLSIFAVGGSLALVAWLILWIFSFYVAIQKIMTTPGVLSSYAMTTLVFCFTSGFFLRSPQLFPVWIFMSMALGACYCWWFSAITPQLSSRRKSESTPAGGDAHAGV